MRFSASMYWIARYVAASTVNAAPSGSSDSYAVAFLAAERVSIRECAREREDQQAGDRAHAMIPSARNRTGRVSSPSERRRETSGTR